MKPRIFLYCGVWHCCSIWLGSMEARVGMGYSPRAAYEDWRKHA